MLLGRSNRSSSQKNKSSMAIPSTATCAISAAKLPDFALLAIFQRCDAVTISRCTRVCRSWRAVIGAEYARETTTGTSLPLSKGFARLFVADRRNMILERFLTPEEVADAASSASPTTTPSTSTPSRPSTAIGRSTSMRTVRSTTSNHSLTVIIEEDRPKTRTLRQRTAPRPVRHVDWQRADMDGNPMWAYRFDNIREWTNNWDVIEVYMQNFASYLERDQSPMAIPTGVVAPPNMSHQMAGAALVQQYGGAIGGLPPLQPPFNYQQPLPQQQMPPPPSNFFQQPAALPPQQYHARFQGGSRYNNLPSSRSLSDQPQAKKDNFLRKMTDEMTDDMRMLSGGRIERLAERLAHIDPLHLNFRDHAYYEKRPIAFLFYFLQLLRPSLHRVTLDGVMAERAIRLDGAMSMANIEHLTVKQPAQHPGLVVNEEILLSWLRLPLSERSPCLRARFHGCRRFSPLGILRFIRAWQAAPEAAAFDFIVVDGDSMHPWEFVKEAGKQEQAKEIEPDQNYIRPPSPDLPAYVTSELEARTAEEKELMARSLEFRHKKGALIRYNYEDGWLVFSFVRATPPAARVPPQGSPPGTPQSFCGGGSPRTPLSGYGSGWGKGQLAGSASGLAVRPMRAARSLVATSSTPSAYHGRSSLPRDASLSAYAQAHFHHHRVGSAGSGSGSSGSFHSFHQGVPPPDSPSIMGRLMQFVLRSNA